jgi:lysophospholipase L1-like esterase
MRIFLLVGVIVISMFLFACPMGGNGGDAFYSEMIARSLISSGNNYRTKQLLEKAANGEEVTIAYIGGSITEGYNKTPDGSYVNGSYEKFKSTFASGDGSHVHYVNAGMGGTPSTLGIIRYKRDVLDRAATPPDLVVIEFAVNDGDDPTEGATYESLVRDILEADNNPAVILLFSVFRSRWNLQERFIPIGESYQLPMISIKDAIVPELDAGNLTNEEFFRDQYHPTAYGFKIMADCIIHYFSTVDAEEQAAADLVIPEDAVIGTQFCGTKMIDSNTTPAGVTINSKGSFLNTDIIMKTFNYEPLRRIFPDNWYKNVTDENNPFSITLTCKNFMIVFKQSKLATFGTAQVYVDGSPDPEITLQANQADAWDNPWTIVLFDNPDAAEHTIEIQMAEASFNKYFTIMALGYTE